MRKIYSLTVALAFVTLAAGAQTKKFVSFPKQAINGKLTKEQASMVNSETAKKLKVTSPHLIQGKQVVANGLPQFRAVSFTDPAGEAVNLNRTAEGYSYSFFGVTQSSVSGQVATVVTASDGSIWIKSPVATFPSASAYVQAEPAEDGTYVVKTGQTFYSEEYEGETYDYQIRNLKYVEHDDGATYESVDEDIVYTYENGTLTLVCDEDHLVGITDTDGNWVGYGDYSSVSTPVTDVPTAAPAGLSYAQYTIQHTGGVEFVEAAIDGNDVYVKKFPQLNPEFVIHGTIDGDKVTFKNGQYLGPDTDLGYHMYLLNISVIEEYWEEYDYHYYSYDIAEGDIVFDYDADAKSFTSTGTFAINAGNATVYYLSLFQEPTFKPFNEVEDIPNNPVFLSYTPFNENYGQSNVTVDIPLSGVETEVLNPEKFYYNVYLDFRNDDGSASDHEGVEPFAFYMDEYPYFTEDLIDIPYNYTDSYDLSVNGSQRTIYFYLDGYDYVGVQSTYTGGGATHRSDLVWLDIVETGIKNVTGIDEHKALKNITYTDLAGQQVAQPTSGVYVKTFKYADGTSKSVKFIKK